MAARYMITLTDDAAQLLESWLGGALRIGAMGPAWVDVAGLDAITDEESASIMARLASGGPIYHAGPPVSTATIPERKD